MDIDTELHATEKNSTFKHSNFPGKCCKEE